VKVLIAFLLTFNAYSYSCPDINSCVETLGKMSGKKYIFAEKIKGFVETTSNLEINADNADTFLTEILHLNGYSRVQTDNKDVYLIINSRDIRYYPHFSYVADKSSTPNFLKNWDYAQLVYKFKNHLQGQSREAANSLRPFMSRYGRIVELVGSGEVIIHELNITLPILLDIIKHADRELSKEEMKKFEENEKIRREERKEDKREERKHKYLNENEPKAEKK
jgi:general secretion pathway protein D